MDKTDHLAGYIDSILFHDSDQGYTIARLRQSGKGDPIPIVGYMPGIVPGETVVCEGVWKRHPKHGQQFEVAKIETRRPADLIGIQKFLESGMVKGIGPIYAKRIVETFGLETLKVIDNDPSRLMEVEGLGGKRIESIAKSWGEHHAIRDVMVFLRGFGVSPGYAQKIYKMYGNTAIEKVRSNPYQLARDIHGIGFKVADGVALGMGMPIQSPLRISAGVEHALWELTSEGHTCYPYQELAGVAGEMLGVESSMAVEAIEGLKQEGRLIQTGDLIALKSMKICELGIGKELARLSSGTCALREVNMEKALTWVEEKLKISLAPEQRDGVATSLKEKIHILTGGPGTGKSTITKAILEISEKLSKHICLAAPTGRAAKRMTEITRRKALTIHALLEVDFTTGGFKRGADKPLKCDLLIIDEASMIDTKLMYALLRAVPSHARVILIGDVDQLPSVGPGNILKDCIQSGLIPTTRLQKIFRQAAGSLIVTNAHKINQGEMPFLGTPTHGRADFTFIEHEEPEKIVSTIVELIQTKLPAKYKFHKFEEIQVLSPMKKGTIGTENLNYVLQGALNHITGGVQRMGKTFKVGDKVMQIRNNYDRNVYNGDVGKVESIDLTDQKMIVQFDKRPVEYEFSDLDELVLAYAVSIHKYQGSECACIIIPIHTSHFKLLHRNLLYTGVTRGKRHVVLVGSKKAIALAVRAEDSQIRHTDLQRALAQYLAEPVVTA